MAENEAMEGKDLAIKEKVDNVVSKIKSGEKLEQEELIISVNGVGIPLIVEKDEKEASHKINILGVHILTLENEELSFTDGWEDALREKTKGIIDIEDLIDQLKNMQMELELQEERRDEIGQAEIGAEEQKDEEDLSKKKEQEEPEQEQTIDKAKMQMAKRYGVSPNQVVHISMNERTKRVTDKYDMAGLTKWGEKYNDIFTLPGDDEYSWKTIGVDKDGNEEEIEMRQLEGKNPNVTIKMEDENSSNKAYKEVRPLAIYKIDSYSSYAIIRDSSGKTQALYCRQEEGKGKEYWGHVIPEAQGKNVKEASVNSRESISHEHYSDYDLAERGKAYEKAKSLEERGFPSKGGRGVQIKEIEGTEQQNRENYIEEIVEKLAEKAVASSMMPMAKTAYMKLHEKELRNRAEKLLTIGEADDKITYDEAVAREEELSKAEKEEMEKKYEGQKVLGQKREM